jgi:xanthosine utilization system XapX-like protein
MQAALEALGALVLLVFVWQLVRLAPPAQARVAMLFGLQVAVGASLIASGASLATKAILAAFLVLGAVALTVPRVLQALSGRPPVHEDVATAVERD